MWWLRGGRVRSEVWMASQGGVERACWGLGEGGLRGWGGGPILGAEHPIRGPQGLHISRVPRSILSRGDPRWGDRSILSHVGGSMSQGHSVHPFEAAPIPRARGILEAAYRAQGMHTGPAQGPHLSQWATQNILSGPPIPWGACPEQPRGCRLAHALLTS